MIILDLPPHASSSDALVKLHWKLGRRTEHCAIFVLKSVVIPIPMSFHIVLTVTFMITYCNYILQLILCIMLKGWAPQNSWLGAMGTL